MKRMKLVNMQRPGSDGEVEGEPRTAARLNNRQTCLKGRNMKKNNVT